MNRPLFALLLLLCPLYVYLGSRNFMWPSDERFHVLVSLNMLQHPWEPRLIDFDDLPRGNVNHWMESRVWLHKPPLGHWLGAMGIKLGGLNPTGYHLPGMLLALISTFFAYRAIGLLGISRPVAFLFALLHGTSPLALKLVAGFWMDLVDLGLLASLSASLYLALRHMRCGGGEYLLGTVVGLGMLSKSFPAALPILVLFLVRPRSSAWLKATFACLMVCFPWQLYTHIRWPEESSREFQYALAHLWKVIEEKDKPFTYYLFALPYNTSLSFIFLAAASLCWLVKRRSFGMQAEHRVLLLFFFIPLITFSLAQTKMENFLVTMAPPVFVAGALAFQSTLSVKWIGRILAPIFCALSLLNSLNVGYQASDPKQKTRVECVKEHLSALETLRPGTNWALIRTGDLYPEAFMALGPYPAYAWHVTPEEDRELRNKGYTPLVLYDEFRSPCLTRWLETKWSRRSMGNRFKEMLK